jgi:hypothetical protein
MGFHRAAPDREAGSESAETVVVRHREVTAPTETIAKRGKVTIEIRSARTHR